MTWCLDLQNIVQGMLHVWRRMKDSCYGRVVSSFEETREREIILSSERLERRGFCRVYVTNALTLLAIGMS